jgi:hypothetical protein
VIGDDDEHLTRLVERHLTLLGHGRQRRGDTGKNARGGNGDNVPAAMQPLRP